MYTIKDYYICTKYIAQYIYQRRLLEIFYLQRGQRDSRQSFCNLEKITKIEKLPFFRHTYDLDVYIKKRKLI